METKRISGRSLFLIRYFLVLVCATPLNLVLDHLLGVEVGSGRDSLIFWSLAVIGVYYFAWKPAKKREEEDDSAPKNNDKDAGQK